MQTLHPLQRQDLWATLHFPEFWPGHLNQKIKSFTLFICIQNWPKCSKNHHHEPYCFSAHSDKNRFTQFKEGQGQPTGNSICLRGEVIKQTSGVSIILARQYCSNTQIGLHRSIQSSLTWKAGYVLQQTVKVFYYFVCSSHIYVALRISSAFC